MLDTETQCVLQSMEMDTPLTARTDSWLMPLPQALVLGEILTLMMMSCGPWEKGKVSKGPLRTPGLLSAPLNAPCH